MADRLFFLKRFHLSLPSLNQSSYRYYMRFIAFDLETTGFLPGMDQITEIGAVRFENGQVDAVFSTLVNPRKPIPEIVTKITGITDEMVKDAPLIDSLLESFAEFCGNDIIVAHNAPFDVQFLTADIKKYESSAPKGVILESKKKREVFAIFLLIYPL